MTRAATKSELGRRRGLRRRSANFKGASANHQTSCWYENRSYRTALPVSSFAEKSGSGVGFRGLAGPHTAALISGAGVAARPQPQHVGGRAHAARNAEWHTGGPTTLKIPADLWDRHYVAEQTLFASDRPAGCS